MVWTLAEQIPVATPREPVSLQEVKDALRIAHDLDDDYLVMAITTAREFLEVQMEQPLVARTYAWISDVAPGTDELCLPTWPIKEVTEITYYDTANVQQTFAASNYEVALHTQPARLRLNPGVTWPLVYDRYDAVTITIVAGYPDSDVPTPTRALQILKMLVADIYEHRGSQIDAKSVCNGTYKHLFWSVRNVTFA